MIFDVVKTVSPQANGLHVLYVTLKASGKVIKIITHASPAGAAGIGTAWVASEISDALLKSC